MAALAMFSACEAVQPLDELIQEDVVESVSLDTVIFSASLASDTKTYLAWSDDTQTFKTVWEESDYIWVYDPTINGWCYFSLVDGAGTTSATFKGSITPQYEYVAVYGSSFWGNKDYIGFYINSAQSNYYNSLTGHYTFSWTANPMVARSYTTDLSFKNICSLLCVSLTGDGEELRNIRFQSHGSGYGAGSIDVYFDGHNPYVGWWETSSTPITVYASGTLSSTPLDLYVVIPPGNYYDGFDIYVETNSGTMKKSTYNEVVFERSQVRKVNIEWDESYLLSWGLIGEMTDSWSYDIPMTFDGDYWVLKDQWLDAYAQFKLRYGGDWAVNYGTSSGNGLEINTAAFVYQDGLNMYVHEPGYYDIYLDPNNAVVYVMAEGAYPDGNIPERNETWGLIGTMTEWSYDIDMNNEGDGIWTLYGQYLEAGAEFKFRANHDWGYNFGGNGNYLPTEGTFDLYEGTNNIYVEYTGYYNLCLDVNARSLYVEYLGNW